MSREAGNVIIGGLIALAFSFSLSLNSPAFSSEETTAHTPPLVSISVPVIAPSQDYCTNIAKPAADTRYELQKQTLLDLQQKIDKKISILTELDQKNRDFEAKLRERAKTAQKGITDIYSKMKPDVAAGQLELIDPAIAVAILGQLNVRVASAILNEMNSQNAAVLTAAMADDAKALQP